MNRHTEVSVTSAAFVENDNALEWYFDELRLSRAYYHLHVATADVSVGLFEGIYSYVPISERSEYVKIHWQPGGSVGVLYMWAKP